MKKMLLLCLCIIVLIVAIPLPMVLNSRKRENNDDKITETSQAETPITPQNKYEDIDYIICEAMQYIDESCDTETKKALIALCKNNYNYLKAQNPEQLNVEITKYSDDTFEELKDLYNQAQVSIQHNKSTVYIPLAKTTRGYTETAEEYPYILSVASPWDVFCEEYCKKDYATGCGISISGIKYLCENGADFTEAISWYLPNFTVQ